MAQGIAGIRLFGPSAGSAVLSGRSGSDQSRKSENSGLAVQTTTGMLEQRAKGETRPVRKGAWIETTSRRFNHVALQQLAGPSIGGPSPCAHTALTQPIVVAPRRLNLKPG